MYVCVEQYGLALERVAEWNTADITDIYEALAYYHNTPEETRRVKQRHERATAEAKQRSSLAPPGN